MTDASRAGSTIHLTDDDLVLHYYGEMPDADERRAATHLTSCAVCHAEYRKLQRVLAVVDEAAVSGAELPPHFERTVWARLEPGLRADRRGFFTGLLTPGRLAWTAAVVVLVCGAFVAGRLSPRPAPFAVDSAAAGQGLREQILLMDLGEHLDRSQTMLVELATSGAEDLEDGRTRAAQLVADNRLYRRTALTAGDATIVQLLDDLERLLVDLVAAPEDLSADEVAAVHRRIEAQGLLFKVRVLSSEIRDRQMSAVRARSTGARSSM